MAGVTAGSALGLARLFGRCPRAFMSAAIHAIPVRQWNCACGAWRACWPGSGLISTCNDISVCYGNTNGNVVDLYCD